MTVISVETAKTYLLERVGELKHQVEHKNPFVFLGAFVILKTLGRLFDVADYEVLRAFAGYDRDESEVVSTGARLMFERFTLSSPEVRAINAEERTLTEGRFLVVSDVHYPTKASINKINLSHKDRQHKSRKDGKLTLSANAFLEDVEGAINKAFDTVKDDEMVSAQLFLNINSQPLIGYGD
jgi:hypothetical protein